MGSHQCKNSEEEVCEFVGNNTECEKIFMELGKSTMKTVGRSGNNEDGKELVRGRTTASHKNQRKVKPIREGALKVSCGQ